MDTPPNTLIERRLAAGGIVVLDAGTGTELERRGASMNTAAWCGAATAEHGALLREVHEDYIRAGAQVITANTFASNPVMLAAAGLGDQFESLNRNAVEIALEARDRAAADSAVAVAGSISHMMPIAPGGSEPDRSRIPSADQFARLCEHMAATLAAAGVDIILMEMMYDPPLANAAIAAAATTGLPLWLGYSARAGASGEARPFNRQDLPLDAMLDAIPAAGAAAVGIMHTHIDLTTDIVARLRTRYPTTPISAYPDSGHFEMPCWQFDPAMTPTRFTQHARGWIDAGAQIIGGCCGLGPAHIEALAKIATRGSA